MVYNNVKELNVTSVSCVFQGKYKYHVEHQILSVILSHFVAGCGQARVLDWSKHGEESQMEGGTTEREGSCCRPVSEGSVMEDNQSLQNCVIFPKYWANSVSFLTVCVTTSELSTPILESDRKISEQLKHGSTFATWRLTLTHNYGVFNHSETQCKVLSFQ